MTHATQDTQAAQANGDGPQPVAVSAAQVEAYESMLASVPDAEAGGYDRILEQLAGAQEPGDLNAPWESQGMEAYLGRQVRIESISKRPSDYSGGLPWFIVCRGHALDTGEEVVFTTGSITAVAQLAKAWQLQAFPLVAVPVQSKRRTAAGFFSQRLEVLG